MKELVAINLGWRSLQLGKIKESEAFTKNTIPYEINRVYIG